MVLVRLHRVAVLAKTLAAGIIVVVHFLSRPFGLALNAEMIVRLEHEVAGAGSGFVDALGKGDRGRHSGPDLFGYGNVFKSSDVFAHRFGGLRLDETAR